MDELFSTSFMPHGHCYFWTPAVVWLMVVSNLLIGLSYVSISSTLTYIVRRIKGLPFQWVFLAFGLFIITCGVTHFMDILTIWQPYYWIDGSIRALCAASSVTTALLLFPLVPKVVTYVEESRAHAARGSHRLHRALEATRTVVWEWNVAEDVVTTTDNLPSVYGVPGIKTVQEGFRLVHPDDVARHNATVAEVATNGGSYCSEFRIVNPDTGNIVWLEERASATMGPNGKVTALVGVVVDITTRKLIEESLKARDEERERLVAELQQAVRARDEFLSVASHELRTPLTTIMLQVTSISTLGKTMDTRIVDRCEKLQRQAERLESLIAKLMEVSRIRAAHLDLDLVPQNLSALAAEIVEETCTRQRVGSGRITFDADPSVVGNWDRVRLVQIITNLVTNALKYGEGKPVQVCVRSEGDDAIFTVRDHGMGIDPKDHERIFNRFERAVSEKNYGGLGLGLWITNEVVKAMRGRITVESRLGEGALFTVRLPKSL